KHRTKKGECTLSFKDLVEGQAGSLFALVPTMGEDDKTRTVLEDLRAVAPGRVWLAATMLYRGYDKRRLHKWRALARFGQVRLLAVNDVLYHHPARRPLQDVVSCIREHVTLETAGRLLEMNAERHLKPPDEMLRLFQDMPD